MYRCRWCRYICIGVGGVGIYIERERFILRNWLTQLWWLAEPKSAGQAGGLETQGRGDPTVCWHKSLLLRGRQSFFSIQAFN